MLTLKKGLSMIIFVVDIIVYLDNFDFGLTTLNLPVVSLAVALQGERHITSEERQRRRLTQQFSQICSSALWVLITQRVF